MCKYLSPEDHGLDWALATRITLHSYARCYNHHWIIGIDDPDSPNYPLRYLWQHLPIGTEVDDLTLRCYKWFAQCSRSRRKGDNYCSERWQNEYHWCSRKHPWDGHVYKTYGMSYEEDHQNGLHHFPDVTSQDLGCPQSLLDHFSYLFVCSNCIQCSNEDDNLRKFAWLIQNFPRISDQKMNWGNAILKYVEPVYLPVDFLHFAVIPDTVKKVDTGGNIVSSGTKNSTVSVPDDSSVRHRNAKPEPLDSIQGADILTTLARQPAHIQKLVLKYIPTISLLSIYSSSRDFEKMITAVLADRVVDEIQMNDTFIRVRGGGFDWDGVYFAKSENDLEESLNPCKSVFIVRSTIEVRQRLLRILLLLTSKVKEVGCLVDWSLDMENVYTDLRFLVDSLNIQLPIKCTTFRGFEDPLLAFFSPQHVVMHIERNAFTELRLDYLKTMPGILSAERITHDRYSEILDVNFMLSMKAPRMKMSFDWKFNKDTVAQLVQEWMNGERVIHRLLFLSGTEISKFGEFYNSLKTTLASAEEYDQIVHKKNRNKYQGKDIHLRVLRITNPATEQQLYVGVSDGSYRVIIVLFEESEKKYIYETTFLHLHGTA